MKCPMNESTAFWKSTAIILPLIRYLSVYYKVIAILRRQYHIILTASWEKIYSVLGGVSQL